MCFFAPVPRELEAPSPDKTYLLLRVLETPASSVPKFLGALCGVLDPRAGQWGGGADVEYPYALSVTLFLCAPGYCSMRMRSCDGG